MEAETIDVHEIMSGLFLGSMKAAMDVDALFALGVRHVLSITNMPIQLPLLRDPTEKLDHRHVKLTDNADSDLLQVLPACIEYIDQSMKGTAGAILVHCSAGVSRSPSVVIGYIMYSQGLSLLTAFATVKQKRKVIDPNLGFLEQLKWFEAFRAHPHLLSILASEDPATSLLLKDETSTEATLEGEIDLQIITTAQTAKILSRYKSFKRKKQQEERMKALLAVWQVDPEQVTPYVEDPAWMMLQDGGEEVYRCTSCDRLLCRVCDEISHRTQWSSRRKGTEGEVATRKKLKCGMMWIEPVGWFPPLQAERGELCCPDCEVEVGHWNWRGEECGCGCWCSPIFALDRGHIKKELFQRTRKTSYPSRQ